MSCLLVEWRLVEGVTYNGYQIRQHPRTQELAWDTIHELVALPPAIDAAIKAGAKGDLHD